MKQETQATRHKSTSHQSQWIGEWTNGRMSERDATDDRRPTKHGFTLMELMMVIVIIGVLAGIVLPRLVGQTEKAHMAEAINMLSVIRKAELSYFDEHSAFLNAPAHNAEVDQTAWTNLGLSMPACSSVEDVPQCYWVYSAGAIDNDPCGSQDGTAVAVRTGFQSGQGHGGNIQLNPDGTWCGTGDYAANGPYPVPSS